MKDILNCWLSPTGQIIKTSREFDENETIAWHENLALCILRDKWNMDFKLDAFAKVHFELNKQIATEVLEELGYIRLQTFGTLKSCWIVPVNKKLTSKQESTIQDWCIDNNKKYNTIFSR